MSILSVPDGFDSNPIVAAACAALFDFCASYGEAAALLPKWRWYSELTERERTAVLARFPRQCGDVEGPDSRSSAAGLASGYRLAAGTGEYADDDSSSGPGWPLPEQVGAPEGDPDEDGTS